MSDPKFPPMPTPYEHPVSGRGGVKVTTIETGDARMKDEIAYARAAVAVLRHTATRRPNEHERTLLLAHIRDAERALERLDTVLDHASSFFPSSDGDL